MDEVTKKSQENPEDHDLLNIELIIADLYTGLKLMERKNNPKKT